MQGQRENRKQPEYAGNFLGTNNITPLNILASHSCTIVTLSIGQSSLYRQYDPNL